MEDQMKKSIHDLVTMIRIRLLSNRKSHQLKNFAAATKITLSRNVVK